VPSAAAREQPVGRVAVVMMMMAVALTAVALAALARVLLFAVSRVALAPPSGEAGA
jgi:hypothetical protein